MSPRVGRPVRAALAGLALASGLLAQEPGQPERLRGDATAKQKVYAQVLASELKAPLLRTEDLLVRAEVEPERWVEGRGPCVHLEGLSVSRLEFRHVEEAALFLSEVLRPDRSPLVATLRGNQVVLIDGPRLQAPKRAARVLQLAWAGEVVATPKDPLEAVRVASPGLREGAAVDVAFESLTLLGTPGSHAYQQMLGRLEAAREHARGERPPPAGARLELLAADHFTFTRGEGERGASYSELKATARGAAFAVAETAERARVLLDWARELLESLDAPGDPMKEMRELAGALRAGGKPASEERKPVQPPGTPGG